MYRSFVGSTRCDLRGPSLVTSILGQAFPWQGKVRPLPLNQIINERSLSELGNLSVAQLPSSFLKHLIETLERNANACVGSKMYR